MFEKRQASYLACTFFLLYALWWGYLQLFVSPDSVQYEFFTGTYGLLALLGGVGGLFIARHWGGWKSLMGKATVLFATGLLFQEFGQLSYSYMYYIYFKGAEVPYPSIGDIGYFGSIFLYIFGTLFLAKASGVKISLRNAKNKLSAFIIPALVLVSSYTIFLQGYEFDWSNPLMIFLDFGYPLGQAAYVSLALLTYYLSRTILGGVMQSKIRYILIALAIQYAADYTFLYQAAQGTWVAGGVNDFLYLLSYFIMTMALFNLRLSDIRQKLA
jgi:hypothetical protein